MSDFDLTIIYLTVSAMPSKWLAFHMGHLLCAAHDRPMVVISKDQMELGRPNTEYLIQEGPYGYWNIYRQLCRGAKLAETKFVATAEDDVLYPPHHFREFRPPDNAVSYNRARWSLFTWDAIYCLRQRICNCTLIAPRELLIEALEERMAKNPDGDAYLDQHVGEVGRPFVDRRLGVTRRKSVEWWSTVPVVQLCHPTGSEAASRNSFKRHGQLKAHDIPYWGSSKTIASEYLGRPAVVDKKHCEVAT